MSEKEIKFLYLNEKDMIEAGVLNYGRCVDCMGDVMALLSQEDYLMGGKYHNDHGVQLIFPEKSDIPDFPLYDSRDRRFMAMPAYLGGRFHMAGQKWYGSNGRNSERGLPRSILMVSLNDVETGAPIAYMSANLLSSMRTGAMPGLTAQYLAPKGAKVLSILGPGTINKTSLACILSKVHTIDTVKIKGSSAASKTALEFRDFVERRFPQIKTIQLCDTLEEAVRDADIISEGVSVINRKWPVVDVDWIKPGCLIISSGTMDFSDHNFIADHMGKVVDNLGMYEEYVNVYEEYNKDGSRKSSGTPGMFFVNMISDGRIQEEEVQHLGDIVRGIDPGRRSDDEIILVSLGGMPILDVGWGHDCYERAKLLGIGTELTLWEEPYKW